jgi:hypothetical protein
MPVIMNYHHILSCLIDISGRINEVFKFVLETFFTKDIQCLFQ